MTGRGCRNLLQSNCAKAHPVHRNGRDILGKNLRRRFLRGQCGDQVFCKRIHARTEDDAVAKMRTMTVGPGDSDAPTHERIDDPLVNVLVTVICATDRPNRSDVLRDTVRTLSSHPNLQHPAIHSYMVAVCDEVMDRVDAIL